MYLSDSLTEVLGTISALASISANTYVVVGYEPKDIIGSSSFDWMHPDEVELAKQLH
jgi:hypothetical protein